MEILIPYVKCMVPFDTIGKRVLEEATIKYLNNFNMTLIEIMAQLPKELYEILEIIQCVNSRIC